jgi:uncharacterized membrane protein YhaH (DUF805 family)
MKKYCANCGVELNEETKFCSKCGAKQTEKTLQKTRFISRLGRLAFFVGIVAAPIIYGISYYFGFPSFIVDIIALLWLGWLIAIIIGRAHDLGYSAGFSVLIILVCAIPVLNAIMLIYLCAIAGSKTSNKYGQPPVGSVKELLTFWRPKTN